MDTRPGRVGGRAIPLGTALPRLFWVTDDAVVARPDFLDRAGSAMEAGGSLCAVQLRAHRTSGRRFFDLAVRLRALASEVEAGLWINDRVDVAMTVRANGVQLGRLALPLEEARRVWGRAPRIGCSVHDPTEAEERFLQGADIVFLGNIFATASHPDRAPLGLDVLKRTTTSGRPIVAIGGISVERVESVLETGAWGLAALSGIWGAADSGAAAGRYVRALDRAIEM